MTLANGLSYLAIPGPSVMPERVLRAMHRSAPNIYYGELLEMMPHIVARLKDVARTKAHVAMYITNGHGSWEAAVSNTLSPGDLVLVPSTGRFAAGWAEMTRAMGVKTEVLDFGKRAAIDLDAVTERLNADTEGRIKAVMTVQTDTSTGVRNDIAALRAAIDKTGHPALLMIDCMASLGCDRFEMDAWGVDVMVVGSQKGLMTPPGMAFVFFNEKADRARETAGCVTHYWDWRPRAGATALYQYFCGTAPTHHLYGLDEALTMIGEEGLDAVWQRHAKIARAVWAAFDHWSEGSLELNIQDPAIRSHSVTAIRAGSAKATALREWCETKAGLTLGIGLGMAELDAPEWHHFFRLGHMGHVNAQMILGALATIEAGMKAVDLPHNPGGIERAASVIAESA